MLSSCADVMDGTSPVFAAVLTQFGEDGRDGSALGVRVSHAACDAAGLHRVVAEWGRMYRALEVDEADEPSRSRRAAVLDTDRTAVFDAVAAAAAAEAASLPEHGEDRPGVELSGWRGSVLWWCMRKVSALGERQHKSRPARALLSFRSEELDALIRRANGSSGTTAPTMAVGKAAALCGGLVRELVRPLHATTTAGTRPSPSSYRIAMPVNLRGDRTGLGISSEYVGNAVHTLCTPAFENGVGASPFNDCAFTGAVHSLGRRVRELPQSVAGEWARHFVNLGQGRLVADCDGGNDDGSVTVAINSQRQLMRNTTLAPELELFGPAAGRCIRVLPGPSDTIQLLPQAAGDGIEVLINLPEALVLPSERRGPGRAVPSEDWRARVESTEFRRAALGL